MENAIMAGKLKPFDVERETRPGKYTDGDGLYLIVASATSKNWNHRYYKDGKQRWLGLGSLKDVSLKDARLARDAARLRVKGDRSTHQTVAREASKTVQNASCGIILRCPTRKYPSSWATSPRQVELRLRCSAF
jgi:hypothetical protein